jgi:hypothetical protein
VIDMMKNLAQRAVIAATALAPALVVLVEVAGRRIY